MTGRPLLFVGGVLAVALTMLVIMGLRVLERDRAELYARFADTREKGIEEAARGVAREVADIGDDLDLASTLLRSAETRKLAERELHAIATIKREYLVMSARTDGGETTKVTAYDAPPGVAQISDAQLEKLLEEADKAPNVLHASSAFAEPDKPAGWYRVFARRPKDGGPVVAVVVDTAVLLRRMKLQHDPLTRIVILDARGAPAAISDTSFAKATRVHTEAFQAILEPTTTSREGTVGSEIARELGLPDALAVVIGVPLVIDRGPPWALLVASSTLALQTQEQTIVRRVVVGGVLVLVLLLSATAYVLHTSFRARTLRERVRLEQRLLHSEKLVTAGQLAAGIAHEIGTPLNVARGRVELSLSHLGAEHREAENQRIVIDQIDRVTRLLQQLLDYVRPAPSTMQDVDVHRALQSVSELLAAQATKRRVSLTVDVDVVSKLRADPDQVQQILVNLALNSIDACSSGGKVVLRAGSRDATTWIEVVDDGVGIPREIQKQVFDPFFTTKKRGQGTGLGLWVVAQLVRAQAAEIELDSTPGTGTKVRITWTVAA